MCEAYIIVCHTVWLLTSCSALCRWFLWLWQCLQSWIRGEDGGIELRTVQWRALLRSLLRSKVLWHQDLRFRKSFCHCDCNQLLSAEPKPGQWQWRLVQPSTAALWYGAACFPADSPIQCRHCACNVQKVEETNRNSEYPNLMLSVLSLCSCKH